MIEKRLYFCTFTSVCDQIVYTVIILNILWYTNGNRDELALFNTVSNITALKNNDYYLNKKLNYCRRTTQQTVSVEITAVR